MKKASKFLLLPACALLLAGCSTETASSSFSSSDISSSESSLPAPKGAWNEQEKKAITDFCGEELPYPSGFDEEHSVEEIHDSSTDTSFLQISSPSKELTIGDYHKELAESGWSVILDYLGEAEQLDSNGTSYYELTKISQDGKKGYDIVYFFIDQGLTKANVIQVYNDFYAETDPKTSWSEDEKTLFENALGEVPPLVKIGKPCAYRSDSENVYLYDMLAKDLTEENVAILEKEGYLIQDELSKARTSHILKKTLDDGNAIFATLYYASGNHISFSFDTEVKKSPSWPSDFLSSFEAKAGYSVPEFGISDVEEYYYYTKAGSLYVYAITNDTGAEWDYGHKLEGKGLIYDSSQGFYAKWDETSCVKVSSSYNSDGNLVFLIEASLLSSPYDIIEKGFPSEQAADFLSKNSIPVSCPAFDFSSLSPYSTCHLIRQDYEDAYPDCLASVKEDPESYDLSKTSTISEIEAKAKELARKATTLQIKIYDPEVDEDERGKGESGYKVNDYLIETLRKAGWSRLTRSENKDYDVAFEDPTGTLLIGVGLIKNVSILTLTYGSGSAHSPKFCFDVEKLSLSQGTKMRRLSLTCDMLPYEVTFTSSDPDAVSVDSEGIVNVASDAEIGSKVTITASIEVPNEGKREAKCEITIAPNYDNESAAKAIADAYNSHFNLKEGDEGYATPTLIDKSDAEEGTTFIYYNLSLSSSLIATVAEAKALVDAYLIPENFESTTEGAWNDNMTIIVNEQELPSSGVDYYWYGESLDVNLAYSVYESDGKVVIDINAYNC